MTNKEDWSENAPAHITTPLDVEYQISVPLNMSYPNKHSSQIPYPLQECAPPLIRLRSRISTTFKYIFQIYAISLQTSISYTCSFQIYAPLLSIILSIAPLL